MLRGRDLRRTRGKETELVRLVLEYLALKKIWCYRINVGALRNPSGRPVFFGVKGHPDIVARKKPRIPGGSGRVVWIECKSGPKAKLSEAQEEWRLMANLHGDIFIVARSLADVE
jgi:hypothetical protein